MVIAPARRAGDPGSNPGPGENFSLKVLDGYSESQNYIYIYFFFLQLSENLLCVSLIQLLVP